MEIVKLKLGDVMKLESELNGFTNKETNEVIYKGFLNLNLSIMLKYELKGLSTFLTNEVKKIEDIRNDLILKYGEKDTITNNIMVKMYDLIKNENGEVVSRSLSEKFQQFTNEYEEFLNREIDVEMPTITKEDLEDIGKTTDNYKILFDLIK